MSWFTESFLLLQLAPHNQSEEATSLGAPSSTSITALKGDVASWWPSRRPPACKWSTEPTSQGVQTGAGLGWGVVTGVESLSSPSHLSGAVFPGPTHPNPPTCLGSVTYGETDAHFLAEIWAFESPDRLGGGEGACSSAVLSKQNCFCLVLRMLFSSNKLWCGSNSNTFFWHLLGSSLWM